jgi:hypothetical protein
MSTKAPEERFRASWDRTEQFYDRLLSNDGWSWLRPIRPLIRHLRRMGYDRRLRAGPSVWILVLSRSREHGLRSGQHRVHLRLQPWGGMVISYISPEGEESFQVSRAAYCEELDRTLSRLLEQPID